MTIPYGNWSIICETPQKRAWDGAIKRLETAIKEAKSIKMVRFSPCRTDTCYHCILPSIHPIVLARLLLAVPRDVTPNCTVSLVRQILRILRMGTCGISVSSPQSLLATRLNHLVMASKKRTAQEQPWWHQQQQTAKRTCNVVTGSYKPKVLPENAKILIQTDRSALWVVPSFMPEYKLSDFAGIRLESRPQVRLRGRVGHAHRDAAFYMMSDIVSMSQGITSTTETTSLHSIYASVQPDASLEVTSAYITFLEAHRKIQALFDDYVLNGCYINLYRDGSDCIGSHNDKEVPEGDMVVGIAFGARRTFRIRDISTGKQVLDIPHEHGMLLVMEGDFQAEFKHEIPIQKKVMCPRLSFTFRRHAQKLSI